ncbi:MAG: signal peptidase I [Clostridia bacterium]|nr:signal peptidase I [Clostridia bacterium]
MKRLIGVIAALLACAALGFAVRLWGMGLVRITGASMNNTLRSGDIVLVTRFDYRGDRRPAFGDVVECRFPGREDTYVKRVMGLPGDDIAFSQGFLTRNGEGVTEPFVSSVTDDYHIRLAEDQYLLLGDNRAESYDSRMPDMGPVGAEAFSGRVRAIVWPPDRIGGVN